MWGIAEEILRNMLDTKYPIFIFWKRVIFYGNQTLENVFQLIFKIVTKHKKISQFSKNCFLENESFS